MTGFGMGEAEVNGVASIVEIKTVNNRYCDIKVRMPVQSLDILQRIENIIQERINRGSVSVLIKIDDGNDRLSEIRLNEGLLASYLQSLHRLKEIALLKEDINLGALLRCKEIFEFVKKEEEEGKWESIKESLNKALHSLIQSREEEGNKLIEDILKSVSHMAKTLKEIEKEKTEHLQEFRDKLIEKIKQLSQNISLDEGRIEMEVSFLAQKSDITEEITRLKSHINQIKRISKTVKPIGKKLEFYTQEMGREINTMGAKSVNQGISQKVIKLKDELEKIKEQSRNIE
jgi:uncharacterized protein (TIGR00255 family)